jgi:N-acetylmuramoyl-L-alanine amidase
MVRSWQARGSKRQSFAVLALAAFAFSFSAFSQAPPAPSVRFVVVLDAAHGGGDQGANLAASQTAPQTSQATQPEKAFTQAFAQRLRALLAARGIAVVTTRDGDSTVDASRRAEQANRARAQACISIHASASGTGVHLYVSSLAPAEPSRLIAWKTAQASYVTRSLALAGSLNAALTHAQVPVTLGRTALAGVDSMACPAVAVELAPLLTSSHTQATPLSDQDYQIRVAGALAAALVQWRSEAQQP